MDFIESCRKFISLDSTEANGNKDLVLFASELCRERGLVYEIQEDTIGDQEHANILVRTQNRQPGLEFLLQTHLDTSDPGPYRLWKKTNSNPFDATILDGKIYGLGTANVKLDFLCKLEALSHFKGVKDWKLPPVLIGTYGEEQGMHGMLKLIRKNKFNAKMAMIGEASSLKIIHAGKGYATVEIKIPFNQEEINYREEHNLKESTSTQTRVFNGKSVHSSAPHLGENAINKMFDYLEQLPQGIMVMQMDGGDNFNTVASHASLELDITQTQNTISEKIVSIYKYIKVLEEEFKQYNDADFSPSHPTLNIGVVRTSNDSITLQGSCRIPPIVSTDIYEKWIRDLQSVCHQYGAQFRVLDYKKPYRTSENSVLVKTSLEILKQLGAKSVLSTVASTNESSLLSRIGVECISLGPGAREENIHTPNEHVRIDELNLAIEFYKKAIERFCL